MPLLEDTDAVVRDTARGSKLVLEEVVLEVPLGSHILVVRGMPPVTHIAT